MSKLTYLVHVNYVPVSVFEKLTLVFVNLFKLTYSHDDIEDKFLPLELMYVCVEDKVDLKNWN